MAILGTYIRNRPRTSAALAFGVLTAALTHFAWFPIARMKGAAPALTLAVGVAHALAGIITGPRIVDRAHTRTPFHACLLGAVTSILATLLLAPPFALWVSATSAGPPSTLSYVVMTALIGLFSFLAVGWAHFLLSIGIGWSLFQLSEGIGHNK